MCDPSFRQLAKIAYLVKSRFRHALPDRFEVYPTPNEGFVNVNMCNIDFAECLQERLSSYEASRIIMLFENDEDARAMAILKRIYPVLKI